MFNFFKKESFDQAIGLDIGPSSIKVVELRKEKEKIILNTYGEVATGPYAGKEAGQSVHLGEEKLREAIEDLFKEAKVSVRDSVIAIDPTSSYITLVKVPKVSDDDLRTMIPLEARKYIPIPLTEVQMDWWHVPTNINISDGENMINIVLAAVSLQTISMYDRLIEKLQLKNVEYEIQGYSLIRSIPAERDGLIMYLDIGSQYTNLSLVHNNTVIDARTISRGSLDSTNQISKALSLTTEKSEEVKRTFGYNGDQSNPYLKDVMELSSYPLFGEVARLSLMYERKYNQDIQGIIVLGGGARVPAFMDAYNKVIHIPGTLGKPFNKVEVPAFLKEMIERVGPSYSTALGCALKKLYHN